jgi:hypothetical protein
MRGFARKEESGNEKTFRIGEGQQQEDSSSSLSLLAAVVVAATRACFMLMSLASVIELASYTCAIVFVLLFFLGVFLFFFSCSIFLFLEVSDPIRYFCAGEDYSSSSSFFFFFFFGCPVLLHFLRHICTYEYPDCSLVSVFFSFFFQLLCFWYLCAHWLLLLLFFFPPFRRRCRICAGCNDVC